MQFLCVLLSFVVKMNFHRIRYTTAGSVSFSVETKNFTTEDTEKIEDTEKRRLYAISLCPSFLCGENEFPPTSIHYPRQRILPILPGWMQSACDRLGQPIVKRAGALARRSVTRRGTSGGDHILR